MNSQRSLQPSESAEELRELLDRAAVALLVVGLDGRILWANQAELDLVGYSEPEYVGRHVAESFVEPEAAAEIFGRLARAESVASYETRIRARDGAIRNVLIDGSALLRGGQLVHSRLVMRDITHLVEREQAARHRAEASNDVKDQFLALLSHELRSPLGSILVWLGLLRQGGFAPAEKERALEIIERSAHSLERIVEDLLHASRIAAGGLLLQPQLVDVRSVVQVAVDAASGDATVKGLTLRRALGEVAIWVMGDTGRLQQAVSNLLSNAIKFTPAGGEVEVSLQSVDGKARLRVADSGEGMSPAFLPFAFERFRQQDSTSTRAHHGLGLGLYVVRHVVAQQGGVVSAESPGPGRGSTFTMLLPLAAEPQGEAIPPDPRGRARSGDGAPDGIAVLLVDDEEDVREALRLILQQNGMVVTTAASASEAYDIIGRLHVDVLLSDLAMPGEDGLSLIRRVRLLPAGRGGRIPAAALSAYAGAKDRRSALLAGFQHHLAKPVDPAHLLDVIASMARESRRHP